MQIQRCWMCIAVQETEMTDLVEALRGAKKNKMSWVEVATIFRRIGREAGADQNRLEREAAVASGYTGGILRRFVIALNFLESGIIAEERRPNRHLLDSSFTAIELIERISRQNPGRAAELMVEIGERRLRVESLRRELSDLRGTPYPLTMVETTARQVMPRTLKVSQLPRAYAASARRLREEVTFARVEALLPEVSGSVDIFHRPLGVPVAPLRCDAIAWMNDRYDEADGFEFVYAPSSMTEVLFSDQLDRAIVASSFFRRHFVVFSNDSDPKFPARAVRILQLLGIRSIGVIALGEKKPIQLAAQVKGVPQPDRRHLLKVLCPGGKWADVY